MSVYYFRWSNDVSSAFRFIASCCDPRELRRMMMLVLVVGVASGLAIGQEAENWPQWRGPRGDGSSSDNQVPTEWNGETGKNIAWKTPLPGWGHSSPIVWNDAVFVTACREEDQARVLLRLDAATGRVVWTKTVLSAPLEKRHKLNSFASGTPATDGSSVFVTFLAPDFGSTTERTPGDLVVAAYDFDGNRRWEVRPGRFASIHGFCSSPVVFEDMVIVNGDHDGNAYIVALKRTTGEQAWLVDRENKTRSYVTPIIREVNGRTQMVMSGSHSVASYDPRSGDRHWYMDGPTEQFVASMVYDGEFFYLTAGFPDRHILAIRPDGSGHVGNDKIVWRTQKNCAYVPSPALCGKYFLVVSDIGVASCYEARTGVPQWTERLDGNHSSSLVTVGDMVFFTSDKGVTSVVRPDDTYQLLAANPLGELCYSSPAICRGSIYFRGDRHLICVRKLTNLD